MKEELVFRECQYFNRWLIVPLCISNVLLIYRCISQIAFGIPFGDYLMPDTALLLVTVFMVAINVLLFFVHLNTVINQEGVYVQAFPLLIRFKFIPWEHIATMDVRKKFGRFAGIHRGFGSISYTMGGWNVLRLTLKNNKKIFIGTKKPKELTDFLSKLDAKREQK